MPPSTCHGIGKRGCPSFVPSGKVGGTLFTERTISCCRASKLTPFRRPLCEYQQGSRLLRPLGIASVGQITQNDLGYPKCLYLARQALGRNERFCGRERWGHYEALRISEIGRLPDNTRLVFGENPSTTLRLALTVSRPQPQHVVQHFRDRLVFVRLFLRSLFVTCLQNCCLTISRLHGDSVGEVVHPALRGHCCALLFSTSQIDANANLTLTLALALSRGEGSGTSG